MYLIVKGVGVCSGRIPYSRVAVQPSITVVDLQNIMSKVPQKIELEIPSSSSSSSSSGCCK